MSFIEYWLPPLLMVGYLLANFAFWLFVQLPLYHYSDKELDVRNIPYQLLVRPYRLTLEKDRWGDTQWVYYNGKYNDSGYDAFESYVGASCVSLLFDFFVLYILYVIGLLYWPLLAIILLWYGFMRLFQMVWRMKRKVDGHHS